MADHLRDDTKKVDFISREEAIEQTCFNCSEKERCNGICDDTCRIRAIPAADVRPVVNGRWKKRGCYAFCSHCGERKAIAWPTTAEELVNVYRMKFCNNCGADMSG